MKKKVLQLSVKRKWFDLIKAGTKREEYREIKSYWVSRLFEYVYKIDADFAEEIAAWIIEENQDYHAYSGLHFYGYTHILFINGYGANRPRVEKEIESITIGKPKKGLCPDEFLGKDYFIIKFK